MDIIIVVVMMNQDQLFLLGNVHPYYAHIVWGWGYTPKIPSNCNTIKFYKWFRGVQRKINHYSRGL